MRRPLALDVSSTPRCRRASAKYRVTRVLGEGAMGVVYRALDPTSTATSRSRRSAALLAPPARDLDGEPLPQRGAGRRPGSHANIVSVYEYAQTGPQRYIAMEYVAGVSLHETVVHGFRLPLADAERHRAAARCARMRPRQGVCTATSSPPTCCSPPRAASKVTDFGIARIDDGNLTRHTTVLGSPGYMAPETLHRRSARRARRHLLLRRAALRGCSPAARPSAARPAR